MNQSDEVSTPGNRSLFSIHLVIVGMSVLALCSGCAELPPVVAEILKPPKTPQQIEERTSDVVTNAVAWGKGKLPTSEGNDKKPAVLVEKHPTHFVSVKRAVLRSQPTELSEAVAVLDYNVGVTAVEDVSVQLPFDGDPDLFPPELIPHWVKVSVGNESGYLPLSSLADDGLMKKQNADDPLPALSGEADYRSVNDILSAWSPVEDETLRGFLSDGNLSGSMPVPKAEPLADAGGGSVWSGIVSGARDAGSSALSSASKLFTKDDVSKAAENVVFDEIGPLQEFQFGRAVAAQVASLHSVLPANDPRSAYVAKVGAAIAAASNDPAPFHGWLFAVMDSPEVDAFAVPGGFVFVTTGLLDFLENEDELAAVLAREVAHLELRHVRKAVGDEKLLPFFTELKKSPSAPVLVETIDEAFELVRDGAGVETEGVADWRAVQLAARVGYDPRSLGDVLGRFASAEEEMPYNGADQAEARASDVHDYLDAFGFSDIFFKGADVRASRYERSIRQ